MENKEFSIVGIKNGGNTWINVFQYPQYGEGLRIELRIQGDTPSMYYHPKDGITFSSGTLTPEFETNVKLVRAIIFQDTITGIQAILKHDGYTLR